MDAPTASRTHAPASPRGNVHITLHLHHAFSGEFIIADRVPLDQCVERYVQDLEEGCIEPSIRIDDDVEGYVPLPMSEEQVSDQLSEQRDSGDFE